MPKLQFKYKDDYEKILMKHNSDKDSITIEYCVENFYDFLIAMGFDKDIIEEYIKVDKLW